MKFGTKVVHSSLSPNKQVKSKTTPIYQTSAFAFSSLEELEGFYQGESPYLYSRVGNPNTDELGMTVAQLEGAPAGVAASSGLGAILSGVVALCGQGDHIVASEDLYGGTYQLLKEELQSFGITTSFVDFSDQQKIEKAITPQTKLLFSETITNPFLRVEDIENLVAFAKTHHLKTMIDNTFATPYLLQPFTMGVDLVVHSATKYIGGHSDITAGVIVGAEEIISAVKTKVVNMGVNLSPFEAWLTCRGNKTLALRMSKQSENAERLATYFQPHPQIEKVFYPKNVSLKGNGAIVTIELSRDCDISTFFRSLGWVKIVPTLAGVETSVSYPLGTSHRALPPQAQEKLGITTHVVRISVGIEELEDIIEQFKHALTSSLK
ncbi:cystathionine beta-lyase/cystathionine gamma-synthase [Bacillus pakistanensis]|uniref:Cystathionine beta-lyase/cystathionine gamma-synthase n=1 Tax=Rossellomorea pakistanensis TaxID=992288 RepID=A0ABS2NDN8_9BACI|nr:aminotransferase class I/II-fold pyridoxal phosphate-dependent enzyme [Bacillus pakistanensis]MBM7585925.1 cystathionine beta-lyase/cystathionine gamma-synthase [Bacillus pakistanensis]